MKRKIIALFFSFVTICCSIGFAACTQGEPPHPHGLQYFAEKAPTCTENGNKAFWYCKTCNIYFTDKNGNAEIVLSSLTIDAKGHDISEIRNFDSENHWHECKVCSEKFDISKHSFDETDKCICEYEITSTENLAYRLSEDRSYYILTGIGETTDEYLYVPREIDGKPVKEIADNAFSGNVNIKSIRISSNVVHIGDSAFLGCSNLNSITIGVNVKTLGDNAFSNCKKLTEINFYARAMNDLENIAFHEQYTSAFFDAGINGEGITVTFSDTVERIPAFLFCISFALEGSPNIINVKMGKNVKSIGDFAFGGCRTLTNIAIPDEVTYIGYGAFGECSGLTGELIIPNKVVLIREQAFIGCRNLTNITIGTSVKQIGWGAFANCSELTSIAIPDSTNEIHSQLFSGCTNLTNIVLPLSVWRIYASAFSNTGLENVYYLGNANDWTNLIIENDNSALSSAKVYFYSSEEPPFNQDGTAYDGNYWRYVDNIPTPWILN
ncbi:MAG: hypothetical protein DBX59_08465 [Bacillota bacterium]|nr:MAG: hypothetical protein DBX59_08465 [Bacillota bacterium]